MAEMAMADETANEQRYHSPSHEWRSPQGCIRWCSCVARNAKTTAQAKWGKKQRLRLRRISLSSFDQFLFVRRLQPTQRISSAIRHHQWAMCLGAVTHHGSIHGCYAFSLLLYIVCSRRYPGVKNTLPTKFLR